MMVLGLLGRKKGMTTLLDEAGQPVPVTVLLAGPCTVIDVRTAATHGYSAVQLGFEPDAKPKASKAQVGHCAERKLPFHSELQEFRCEQAEQFTVGQQLTVGAFKKGEKVDVRGCTKGRGFQGVIKRWGKAGGPGAHGSHFHRSTGSIGQRTWPGRVFKNMKMPGQMGAVDRTIRGLQVVGVDSSTNLLFVQGAVPGARNGLVRVTCPSPDFASRFQQTPTGVDGHGAAQ